MKSSRRPKPKITARASMELFWQKLSDITSEKKIAPVTGEEQERIIRRVKLVKLGLSKQDIDELLAKGHKR